MFAVAAALVTLAFARQERPIRDAHIFRSNTEVVSVTVTVRDAQGQLVTDLPRDAFDVREDGESQGVTQFTRERVPLSLVVLLDTSDSMFGSRLQDARDAVERFVTGLLDPSDEFAIAAFNHQLRVVLDWTDSVTGVHNVLERLRSTGSTALYDAISGVLPLIDLRHRERAAVLVISDGTDTASDAKLRDVQSALNRNEAFVYAVAIDAPDRRPINASVNTVALATITDQSGGHTETVQSTGALLDALQRIAEELNHQYLVGYATPRRPDEKYHTIRVRIRDHPDYHVQARRGYVATRRE
jgi:Ca-activated chloride channel family protein